ncbi:hypothetical protein [Streptomyces sp. Wb2n-11]|uniref:hypothetical protein n=1 Tax=Streptomyces sp. Wb2n-11 TaxID=1030533 RepID=UPI000B179060|nr:hypothetical protein [Streptomyces sp. Wb2n-11]
MRRVWEQARGRRPAETGAGEREAADEEPVTPEVEALLAAVRRPSPRRGEESAQAALAAYREARDSGAHALPGRWWRARGRDDWRPSRRRRGALPVRAAFASAAATVTLGGMALAAGTGAIPAPFGHGGGGGSGTDGGTGAGTAGTRSSAPATPGAERGSAGDTVTGGAERRPSAGATRPVTALPSRTRDDVEYCAVYLASDGRGAASRGGAAPGRPTADAAAAGQSVEAYCEDVLEAGKRPGQEAEGEGSPKAPRPSKAPKPPKSSKPSKAAGAPRTPEPPARPAGGAAKPGHPVKPAKPAKPTKSVEPAGKGEGEGGSEGKGGGGRQSGNGAQRNGESGPRKQ